MQEVEVREHIGYDCPGPVQQQFGRRRHLQILQERETAQIEQHQDHTRQPYNNEQADVDIDQLRQDIPGIEGLLEISKNIAHCLNRSFSNTEPGNNRRTYRPGVRNAQQSRRHCWQRP